MRAATLALLVLSAASCGGCKRSSASPNEQPPPGEAWLDDKQISEQKIEIATVDEQDVDDTVLASGKVTFDDARVSHVFSLSPARSSRSSRSSVKS